MVFSLQIELNLFFLIVKYKLFVFDFFSLHEFSLQ